jgi:flagellar hook assembly protein FlgD
MVKVGDVSSIVNLPSSIINLTIQPNPFSNSTNIIFTIPQDETVTLSIYDIFGREVKQRMSYYKAGEHKMEWSGEDSRGIPLARGLYHIRLRAGGDEKSMKAIFIR